MDAEPGGEPIASDRGCYDGGDTAQLDDVAGPRGSRDEANANMMEDDQMAVELEEEFQRLCGEEAQVESIKLCNRVGKAIKNIEVLVMAEVARSMRCGHPIRASIEEVGKVATETAMNELGTLRVKCKESAVMEKWVQVVLDSLECNTRVQGVEQLAELLEMRDELRRLSEEHGVPTDRFPQRFKDIVKENESLQESVRAQQSELAELRELKRRLAEQERELLQMRRAMAPVESAVPEPASRRRRGIDVLNALRPELKTHREADALQNRASEDSRRTAVTAERTVSRAMQCGQRRSQSGECMVSVNGDESDVEESVSEVGRDTQMAHYLKYLALPEVRPYSGEDPAYSFSTFWESFTLKYPRSSWSEAELSALFRAKLTGKARTQYEALPSIVREGSFVAQVEALRQECRAELSNHRIVALGELKKLRKKEGQSVADFCVELERLTRRAHPHMDEAALDAERAQLLYEQLAHWNDSYHLMEALESDNHAYDKLKQTALRIERRNWTLRNSGMVVRAGRGNSREPNKPKSMGMYVTKAMDDLIILGTNVLPALGYELRQQLPSGQPMPKRRGEQAEQRKLQANLPDECRLRVACVAQRAYVVPGSVSWVRLEGCDQSTECMLTSSHELIQSGVCRAGVDGVVEVPVVNRSQEPAVLRVGEAVGRWEEKDEDWNELDMDDYKMELMRGLQLIRDEVKDHAEKYREKMKRYFDARQAVEERRLPKVGARVFMKLPREREQSRHPKLTIEWDGPFRVLETSDNSALITRIGCEEEPLRIQMDLLRVAPEEIDDEPVKARTGGNREGPTARATLQACEILPTYFFGVKSSSNAGNPRSKSTLRGWARRHGRQ
ncbi:unnamed protein product [Heligmosomoides polygyrus]|uniref:CCHC-type domain-containing protein n=1 Tax=Heligmosomoides polygyrus TaxID=6339 RepID=A0A183FEM6_HELPZ|nr:unnamed protein product [Heligmosomoides polygyrus]